jgi:hypothetical protein
VDWAISESEHTCDWVYHGRGGFTTATALKPPDIFLGLREGYGQIENPYQSAPARSFQATWDLGDAKGWVHLALASDEPAILFTGLGYGFNAAEKLPLVIARRTGRQILWVSLLTSDMERQTQTAVRIERAAPELTRVQVQSLAAEWICEVAMVNGRTIVAWARTAGSSPLSPLSTDFDSDGIIGFSDFFLFAERFGASHDEPIYDVRFDLDGDGRIGFEDFFLLARDFGRSALNLGSTGE